MISLSDNLSVAFNSILANKLRSVLTMLGIIIGISAVITIVSIGAGQGQKMKDELNKYGLANITINAQQAEGSEKSDDHPVVIDQDLLRSVYEKYANQCKGISIRYDLSMNDDFSEYYIKTKRYTGQVGYQAVSTGYWEETKREFPYGAPFTDTENSKEMHVIVLAEATAKALFGKADESVIGETVETYFQNAYATFTVKGIFRPADEYDGCFTQDPVTEQFGVIPFAFIPLKTYQKLTNSSNDFKDCIIIPDASEGGEAIIQLVENINADMAAGADEYVQYEVNSGVDYIKQASEDLSRSYLITALVAAIALLVGGIGVMNIMMVSIMERTKEIGTRKALGATNGSLLAQFITESIVLCLIGGIIGMILGIVGGVIACRTQQLTYILDPLSIVVSIGFSMLIGVFFGYYPASRAAKMDPIDALRYE